jgi:hypothetical protein
MTDFPSPVQRQRLPIRQRGQALIFGIVVLLGAAVATFYLFNTGQMTAEKTKLVNTADAVAYSAGVMHARALNFDAYTNRALLANEAAIAQMVSVSSWLEYAAGHVRGVRPLNCYTQYSIPAGLFTLEYVPLCYALSYPAGYLVVQQADNLFNVSNAGGMAVIRAEIAKTELKAMQTAMFFGFTLARTSLMRDVADANYRDDGSVSVDTLPLKDDWNALEGSGSFINQRSGDERLRMRNAILEVVEGDHFVKQRDWYSESPWPCSVPIGQAKRTGGTVLNGYDSWEANDEANFKIRELTLRGLRLRCRDIANYQLGRGHRKASASDAWRYSGVPDFYELSDRALGYTPANGDPAKREPRLQFAIRLTRANGQTRTSAGTSGIKPTGRLDVFDSAAAGGVLAAVSTSEVYFDHERKDKSTELGSLFNPYWQVHLVGNSAASVAAARLLQGATP